MLRRVDLDEVVSCMRTDVLSCEAGAGCLDGFIVSADEALLLNQVKCENAIRIVDVRAVNREYRHPS